MVSGRKTPQSLRCSMHKTMGLVINLFISAEDRISQRRTLPCNLSLLAIAHQIIHAVSDDHLSEWTDSEYYATGAQGLGRVANDCTAFPITQLKSRVGAANYRKIQLLPPSPTIRTSTSALVHTYTMDTYDNSVPLHRSEILYQEPHIVRDSMLECYYRRGGRRVPNICSGCGVHAVYPTALEINFDQQGYGWRAVLGFGYLTYLELRVAVGAKGWESNLQVLVSILRVQRRNT
ncbi:hypothetical protein B9Z19DRAFT_1067096 [Tuber borchii]|uniref:Uncharacterized protein n=1 Tax=Tuber borchii TaxID=42251 RepID=A0A2T6ZK36_TUBBO|nr:hypothetical protein B9Z19DRAFT_1067096 [Tuber borchii]